MKKFVTIILAAVMALSATACAGSAKTTETTKAAGDGTTAASAETTAPADTTAATTDPYSKTFDQLVVGEDGKDLNVELKVITHRTDLVDTVFQDYIKEFNKIYPNIKISYEGITNYQEDMTTRLATSDWGDICMIVNTIDKKDLGTYFKPLGDQATLSEKYLFMQDKSFEGVSYGIASTGNAQGIVYNKAVFAEAGITAIPKTPTEFIAALQLIKDNTDAIPLYTNFAAGWTMVAWDAYINGSATGDANFMNQILPHAKDPFANRGDETGPYAVYSVLYDAVAKGLVEDDPTTTDWEACKAMINNGEIGTMVLGSWAVVQMQQAGENADDIGYMSFPITVDGKQYASAGPDYCYGVNVNSSADKQLAAELYIKWLTESSNFAYDQGGIPVVIGAEYPATLKDFSGVTLVVDNPALAGEEGLLGVINTDSELGINSDPKHVSAIVEAALDGSKTLDDIVAEWNTSWTTAQEDAGVTPG